MKIIQVVPFIGAESSGPAYSVPNLCRALIDNGEKVELHVLAPTPKSVADLNIKSYPRHKYPHSSLGRSPEMLRGLQIVCQSADIIHNNSLWMLPNIYPAQACKGNNCKIVTSPRGTLASWSLNRSKWKKKIIGLYGQYQALKNTDMFHATCIKEYEEIRNAGFKQPIAIIPIGMEIKNNCNTSKKGNHKILFFGRLHEVKAVDHLLKAWNILANSRPEWEIIIAGPDAGAKNNLLQLVSQLKIPRVSFIGEVNGSAKYDLLSSVDLYVLPSKTENFAVTVAEALSCSTPVIASTGTPWDGLVLKNAGWHYEVGVAGLIKALQEAINLPLETLKIMGKNGQNWINDDFSWRSVGVKTSAAYQWLLEKGDKPKWVITE